MELIKNLNATYNGNYQGNDKIYKWKYICFNCRKSFKRVSDQDLDTKNVSEAPHKCPSCGKHTHIIGPKFRPPNKHNEARWKSLEILVKLNVSDFHGWATDEIEIPNSKSKLKTLLNELANRSKIQISLWSKSNDKSASDQIRHHSEELDNINSEIEKLE